MLKFRFKDRIERDYREFLNVGIGEYKVSKSPAILATWSLGSCVAVIIYDCKSKVGGLLHAMLPRSASRSKTSNMIFVNTGIIDMLKAMIGLGAHEGYFVSAIIGGANILNLKADLVVGEKNYRVAKETLKELGIPVVGEDVGGDRGRNVLVDLSTGEIFIEYAKHLSAYTSKQNTQRSVTP
ncbi:MAG: chemotaxis protein CheD [Candidatus Methanomethylicaceae archaeon]